MPPSPPPPPPRLPPPHRRAANPSTSLIATAPSSTSSSTLRRNLFHSHLSRRPPAGTSTSTSSSSHLNSTLGSTSGLGSSSGLGIASSDIQSLDSDILVRNANGEYIVNVPGLPVLEGGGGAGMGDGDELGGEEGERDGDLEREGDIESRLAEMLNSRTRQSSEQELVDAVRKSLRRKVDALAQDEWIFEGHDSNV